MIKPKANYYLEEPAPYGFVGSSHAVSSERAEENRIMQLRQVVAEVTGNRIPVPALRGPRF